MYNYIDVSRITGSGYYLEENIDLDDQSFVEEENRFLSNVDLKVNFYRRQDRILARGTIRTSISLSCVRCLDIFQFPIHSDFDIVLYPIDQITDFDSHLSGEDMGYVFYRDEKIDIRAMIVDQVNLLIPVKPLCNPNCRGICSRCGVNLNHEECNCSSGGN